MEKSSYFLIKIYDAAERVGLKLDLLSTKTWQRKTKLRLHFNINTIICVDLFFYLSFIVFPALDLVSAADL